MVTDGVMASARRITAARGRRARLNSTECDDLLQDVLIKYLDAWPDTAEPDNVDAWLETVTANAIRDRVKLAENRRAVRYGDDDPLARIVEVRRSTKFASLQPVTDEILGRVFGLIPEADGQLLRRREIDGESAAEVADDLGISVAAVDQRTSRARKRLINALADHPELVDELRNPHPHVY